MYGSRTLAITVVVSLVAALPVFAAPAAAGAQETQAALQVLREGARASDSDTLRIVHDGVVLLDQRRPDTPADGLETMSVTKSLVALAIGRLLTQGRIDTIDQPVADFYPEWRQGRKAGITVRMLLDHTSGLQNVPDTRVEIYPAPDGLQLALAAELSDAPGERFSYNNKAMNLLAGVVERASGKRMDRYIADELLAPMGVGGRVWNADGFDRAGNPYAMAGWNATADAMARVGQLVLDGGRWQGAPLVDGGFVCEMLAPGEREPHYGLLWWRKSETMDLFVDAAALDRFREAGVDAGVLDGMQALVGRTFADSQALRAGVAEAVDGGIGALAEAAAARSQDVEALFGVGGGPVVAYEANGWRGQYIVVVPQARLVAVRQVGGRDVADDAPWPYGYPDFTQQVVALAKTLAPDLAVDDAPCGGADQR
ncbi:beta-lactamase family protein [Luteimonas sp. BDR2-5]|uniref:serine hydrolase domain-containing protein n=1 Tax=Proluteimonas luteida TaxID=2878685 RepID=UPI001E522D48|nr:serine hydrolase domain-containing protein [Luteimonas sp. BDR2-5]MCD9027410.1 beta-lactamase family protein [Luteimonas sp. BDR2-5]